jgi:hypothetical protein
VKDTGGNQDFLTDDWPEDLCSDFEFNIALQDHHHFVDGMSVIFPGLAGRIGPDVAAEAARAPVGANCVDVYHTTTGTVYAAVLTV